MKHGRDTVSGDTTPEYIPKKCKYTDDDYTSYPYILTVIDMQVKFDAAHNNNTIDAVKGLITDAKKDNAFVMIAQYKNYGETHRSITNMVKKYKPHAYAIANKNDKSRAIQNKLVSRKVKSPIFKICGVNTGACVLATVQGLSTCMKATEIQVIERACNSSGGKIFHDDGINQMKKLPNVTIH